MKSNTKLAFADISPKQAKKLLGSEIGTQFDVRERMFSYWGDGTVFDYSLAPGQKPI